MNGFLFQTFLVIMATSIFAPIAFVHADSGVYDVFDFDVDFIIENGDLLVMDLDFDFTSLIIEIISYEDGFIEVSIPRGLVDSKYSDTVDDIFYVIIDGVESDYLELDSSVNSRTLIIPFFADDQEIEIFGTDVLSKTPKFPGSSVEIPTWVKDTAGWWAENKVDDANFIGGIQYMINTGIIVIPDLPEPIGNGNEIVPEWAKNNAGWWANELISEAEFVNSIKYLVAQGIIVV